jgi:hypothetical protein
LHHRHKTHDACRRSIRAQPDRPAARRKCPCGAVQPAICPAPAGKFILLLDDTDRARSKPEYEAAIERDLA